MSNGKVSLIVIEYETKDTTNWKAGILAFKQKEALATIRTRVPTFDKMISIGVVREIDAVSQEVYDAYFVVKEAPKAIDAVETVEPYEEEVFESDDDNEYCPFCSKSFKTQNTLLTHIKKFH